MVTILIAKNVMPRAGRNSRPHTSTRPLTATAVRRPLSAAPGGGDTIPIDLDDELQTVLKKEYDDGEPGKQEAIHDVKAVLHQVAQDPMAQQMDKLIPRFLVPPKSAQHEDSGPARAQPSSSKTRPRATPRHAKLTARPTTAKGKSGNRFTDERPSVPNMTHDELVPYESMRITASAPNIPETRWNTTSSVSSTEPISSSSSKIKSRLSTIIASTTHTSQQDAESSLSTTAPMTAAVGRSGESDHAESQEVVGFTENLLEITSDTEEADEIWKSDIVALTRIKSTPKGKPFKQPNSLELKYKDPIWPHQLFLHQILARVPSLTHLVLDGSELRFLRDLGSSLQSLITLSICECGLRSLDGIYGIPNLRTLIARKNMISIPTQLSFLRKLGYLDLSSNPISSTDEFGSLRHCGELRILKLYDTPLAITHSNFNKEIKRLVPQLKEIHPTRLYDLIGMPKLMVRGNSQIIRTDTKKEAAGDHHQKPGQKQMWEESKQVEEAEAMMIVAGGRGEETNNKKGKSRRNDPSVMPSLAYTDVMVDHPKPGIAYQKIKTGKTLQEQEEEHRQKQSEIQDVSLGTGDFTGIFMAPKFLQHLEETMPPSTAEEEEDEEEDGVSQTQKKHQQKPESHHRHYLLETSDAGLANFHQNKLLRQTGSQEILQRGKKVCEKKSDMGLQEPEDYQQKHSSKNHPRGDGDQG